MSLRDQIGRMVGEALKGSRMPFEDFCDKYLSHHFPLPSSRFHVALKDRLEYITDHRDNSDVWIAPRGNAKSTLISLAYILYCICEGTEKYIVLVSDTHGQAVQFLNDIKLELENNAALARDYPLATGKGAKWSNDEIISKNNIMVTVMGMEGKIRGRKFGTHRPTLIVIDDPENDKSALSAKQRQSTREWLSKGAVAAGVPGYTNIVIIGTVINADCLVKTLAEGEHGLGGWKAFFFQSIIEWPSNMDLWDKWQEVYHSDQTEGKSEARAFYDTHKAEMDEGAIVLWPERESLYRLMSYRARIGRVAFESEKQNRAINPDQCLFSEEWFDDIRFTNEPWFEKRDGWYCFGAVDPSVPGKDGARPGDYCAIVIIYWRPGHKYLYVYSIVERMANGVLARTLFDLHRIHKFDSLCFEINGFQSVLADAIRKESDERGVRLPITTMTHNDPKPFRIARLGVLFENHFFKFKDRNKGNDRIIKQAKMYPRGDHDDGPDALEMCHWQITEFVQSLRAA